MPEAAAPQEQRQVVDVMDFANVVRIAHPAVDTPVVDHPAATAAAAAQPEVAPPVVDTPDPAADNWNKILNPEKPVELDDAFKTNFKNYFGADDPQKFKEHVNSLSTERDLYKTKADELQQLSDNFSKLSPAAQRAMQLEWEGQDGVGYIRSLPDTVFRNKEAKELSSQQLIDTYEGGKVSPEEWQALKDGNFDDLNISKEALEYKVNTFRTVAEHKHEQQRQSILSELQAGNEQRKKTLDEYNRGIAEAIAEARAVLGPFVTEETITNYTNGKLVNGLFFQQDGIPAKQSLTNALKAQLYDEYGARKEALGYKRGREEGILEANSKLPTGPSHSGRVALDPAEINKQQEAGKSLRNILNS